MTIKYDLHVLRCFFPIVTLAFSYRELIYEKNMAFRGFSSRRELGVCVDNVCRAKVVISECL